MKKVLRVKDLFHQIDEKYCIRMSEVSLSKYLPSSYQYALIERSSSNRCMIYLKKYCDALPCLYCNIFLMLLYRVFPLVVQILSLISHGNSVESNQGFA